MSADASRNTTTPPAGKIARWRTLPRRYAARRSLHRRIPWLGYALSSINVVAIAFLILDAPLGKAARDLSPQLISIAGMVTDIGRLVWVLVAICTVLAAGLLAALRLADMRRRFRTAYFGGMASYVAASVLSASAVVHILKYAIGRARPILYDQYGILGFRPFDGGFLFQSFPSAHAAHVGALFAALALLFPRFRLIFAGLGLWFAATRIIIGVHYPSDVAAGLALGAWFAFAMALLFSRFGLVFVAGPNGWPVPRLGHVLGRTRSRRKSVKNL